MQIPFRGSRKQVFFLIYRKLSDKFSRTETGIKIPSNNF